MDHYQKLFNASRPLSDSSSVKLDPATFSEQVQAPWFRQGVAAGRALEVEDYSEAKRLLDAVLTEKPNHRTFQLMRGYAKQESGDYVGALADYRDSLKQGDDWYAKYFHVGYCFQRLKDFERAVLAYTVAIQQKQQLPSERIDESVLPRTQNGVTIRVNEEVLYTNRANARLSLDDFYGTMDDCKKAVEANPNYPNSWFIMGLLNLKVDDANGAYQHLKMAEKLGFARATSVLQQYFE